MKNIYRKIPFFVIADAILISTSVLMAFLIRFELQIPARYFLNIQGIIVLSLIITIPIFYFFKLYYISWSYVSTEELVSLIKATILSFLILTAGFFILREHRIFSGFPRSILFITYFFIFFLCGFLRFSKRIYHHIFKEKREKERTLIIGAGDAGEQILRSMIFSYFLPVGFVDDNIEKQKRLIHGLRVLGRIKDIPKIVQENKIEGMIIAIPSANSSAIYKAIEKGKEAGLKKIKVVPSLEEIISGKVSIGQLKEVEVNDLLGRDQVSLDTKLIENSIKNKRVLVTGAAGSIGSELCRQIIKFNPAKLIVLDQDETGIFDINRELKVTSFVADITDKPRIEKIFQEIKPEVVFHAAAYKHVPLMEKQPEEAIKNNIFGTELLANLSLENQVDKFILISTDKAVNPVSVMGQSKRVAEMICQVFNQKNHTRFISVRFGNVLGSRGSVVPLFKEKIRKREPIEITHPEMKRYFMTTPEACLLVMQAGAMGKGGEVFVLDMGDPVKIEYLAREMIKLSGLKPDKDIPIVYTEPRPGEKLFEELLTAEEGSIATENKKIFQAKLSQIEEKELKNNLEKLKNNLAKEEIRNILKLFTKKT